MTEPGPINDQYERTLRCLGCEYDLRGIPSDSDCPECGMPVAASERMIRAVTARTLFVIGCRITTIIVFVMYLPGLFSTLFYVVIGSGMYASGYPQLMPWIIQVTTWVVMAVVLWAAAPAISRFAVPDNGPLVARDPDLSEKLVVAAFGITGMVFLFTAVIGLIWFTLQLAEIVPSNPRDYEYTGTKAESLASSVIYALGGLWFMRGRHGMIATWRWLRHAGSNAPPAN